jgi:hypothetical protein
VARGGKIHVLEGTWEPGRIVLIEFPDAQAARDWYASPAYQEILPLRTRNCETGMLVVEGQVSLTSVSGSGLLIAGDRESLGGRPARRAPRQPSRVSLVQS